MKIAKDKIKATAITLFLVFAMVISLVVLPSANAQYKKDSYAIIFAKPNPVGVDQECLIAYGITEAANSGTNVGWGGITVTVKRPDGTTETLGPFRTDTTGLSGVTYMPKMAGTYILQTHFPDNIANWPVAGLAAGTIMKASDSEEYALTVTEEPREYYPGVPLPTEYWSRPIDAQLREWSAIAGNWPASWATWEGWYDRANPYVEAPESAHILWAKVLDEGGLVGQNLYATDIDSRAYEHGDAYQGKFYGTVIMNGILFYNKVTRPGEKFVVAVDLKTGEELWCKTLGNNETLTFGQIMYWETMNLYGCYSYLWTTVGSTWNAYDPTTGRWEYTIINMPITDWTWELTSTVGPRGEFLTYVVDQANGWMALWNSTAAVPGESYGNASWNPWNRVWDASLPCAYSWNVTIPKGLPGSPVMLLKDRIIGNNVGWGSGSYADANGTANVPAFWGISIKTEDAGRLIFNTTWTRPEPDLTIGIPETFPASLEDGVFVVAAKENRQYYGLSLDTGKQLWGPTTPKEPDLNAFTLQAFRGDWGQSCSYNGMLLTSGMAGQINAYNITNGLRLWNYNATDPYTEAPFSNLWDIPIMLISGGKIYCCHYEHSANQPLPRGAPVVCLNATTGEEIWKVNGLRISSRSGGQPVLADGVIVAMNTYDNRIIAIGKGPSATTVAASPKVSVHGSSVLVEGMVTDVSPGTDDGILSMRFPNGVPAVADESMSEWMLYVYQQLPRPANATGVEVVVSVLDPNNNCYEVGRATSDADGMFHCAFTPPVPGEYTIIASFAGSKSYWPSHAETAINVEEAPAATPAPTPTPAPMTDTYIMGFGIGMIIAIIVVGLLLFLLLRKR
jgi:hypothetical protein